MKTTKIFEAKNHILIYTENLTPAKHRHHAAHIIISLGGEISVTCGHETYICHGAMIPSGVPHYIKAENQPLLVFMYDCTTVTAKSIECFSQLSSRQCDLVKNDFFLKENKFPDRYPDFESSVLETLSLPQSSSRITDERIIKAIQYMTDNISEKVTCSETAAAVSLSSGRFSHLFRQQTGMTFASYLVYMKLMYAYSIIFSGKSITEAAIEAGFSGSSHFADVNRRVFGFTAKDISGNMVFIKTR